MGSEKSPTCLHRNKENPAKVPKRIHKAERERKKREHLNELFLELADALGLTEQSSGKASILGETTRVVKNMLDQIESLKKENAALLSESQYVTVEKNELQDDTSVLQIQVSELKSTIKERTAQTTLDLNAPAAESPEPNHPQHAPKPPPGEQFRNPVLIIPTSHNYQLHPQPHSKTIISNTPSPMSNVSKPHPRYPTPSDSWPFRLLENPSLEVGEVLNREHK